MPIIYKIRQLQYESTDIMNVTINTNSLENLKYTLYTSAKILNSVWNDKQYNYFIHQYVRPVTEDVQVATNKLNEQIASLRIIVDELENLAGNY